MLILSSQLEGLPILSLQMGSGVGLINRPIIDPNNLVVPAFFCQTDTDRTEKILHSDDIRELGLAGAIIDNEDLIMPDEDLVRLKSIIKLNFDLIGTQVVTNHGQRIGKVGEYVLNSKTFMVQKIHVNQSLLRSFSIGSRIIDRSQIIEVDGRRVVVRESDVKAAEKAKAIGFTPQAHS
jgi:uncharacterized protein YrrD